MKCYLLDSCGDFMTSLAVNPKEKTGSKYQRIFLGLGISLVIILIYSLNISKLHSVVLYADDFHYWASGAFFAGYDWSSLMRHDFYYSYGYGFLLAPLFLLTDDGTMLYRLGICLNIAFLLSGFWLMIKIINKLYPGAKWYMPYLIAFAACSYPALMVQVNSAMCEALMFFVFTLIIYGLSCIRWKDDSAVKPESKKENIACVILGLLNVYAFMIHQRFLVVTIALSGTFFVLWLRNKISFKQILCFLTASLGMLSIHLLIYPVYMDFLYENPGMFGLDRSGELRDALLWLYESIIIVAAAIIVLLHFILKYIHSDYAGSFSVKIKSVRISEKNIKNVFAILVCSGVAVLLLFLIFVIFMQEYDYRGLNNSFGSIIQRLANMMHADNMRKFGLFFLGHNYYVFTASAGLAMYALFYLIQRLIRAKRGASLIGRTGIPLFLPAALIFMLLLSVVAAYGASNRPDTFVYGRYIEFVFPVFIAIALCSLFLERPGFWCAGMCILAILLLIKPVSDYFINAALSNQFDDTRFISVNTSGIVWKFGKDQYRVIFAAVVAACCFVVLVICAMQKFGWIKAVALICLSCFFLFEGNYAVNQYVIPEQQRMNRSDKIAHYAKETSSDVYFVNDVFRNVHIHGYLQMKLPKKQITAIGRRNIHELPDSCIVLCYADDINAIELLTDYDFIIQQTSNQCVLLAR